MSPDNLVSFPSNGSARPHGDVCAEFCARWRGHDPAEGARLLRGVLPPRVPGALQLTIARALGELDVPPFATPEEFRAAVRRFASAPSDLGDISDVRRARRRARVTLDRIALEMAVPPHVVRQLEWGDFRGWHHAEWTRRVCHAYARAAGLDPDRVHAIVEDERSQQHAAPARLVAPASADIRPRTGRFLAAAAAVFAAGLAAGGLIVDFTAANRGARVQELVSTVATAAGAAREAVRRQAARVGDADAPPVTRETDAAARDLESSAAIPQNALARANPQPPAADELPADAAPAEPVDDRVEAAPSPAPAAAPVESTPQNAIVTSRASMNRRETPRVHRASVSGPASFSPAFSNVGSAVFYHRDEGAGSALIKADTDTTTGDLRIVKLVEDGARNYHVKPSPDGTRIAFDSDRDGERGVYIANADGSDVRRVSGPGFAAVPSWSPDGTRLAFVRGEASKNSRVWNLWVLDLRSDASVRLTSYRYGQPWGASWFPDGRRLAFSHEDRLTVLDLQTGARRVFKSPRAGRLLRTPAVSPDGRHVAFQVYRDGGWLLDLSDGSMQRILADPTAEEFAWDAAGRRLAFHSRRSGEWSVWVMANPSSPTS